jgi:hypothetical protein
LFFRHHATPAATGTWCLLSALGYCRGSDCLIPASQSKHSGFDDRAKLVEEWLDPKKAAQHFLLRLPQSGFLASSFFKYCKMAAKA